jgi:hypothetical protein
MRWRRRGPIFSVDGGSGWMAHHACLPIADPVGDGRLRIYFAPRDEAGFSSATFIEVDADDPSKVLYVHDRPVLGMGERGAFDDTGVMPCSILDHDGRKYLYYVGWNRSVSVPYRNAIGLAISDDGGLTFERVGNGGPIADRTPLEPYFCASPFVMRDEGRWRMWYASSTGWLEVDGRHEPLYQVKYAESDDGIAWRRDNVTCLEYRFHGEANARPVVVRDGDLYRMWYTWRGSVGYRTDPAQSYRIGYAESPDGVRWERRDEVGGLLPGGDGWESVMVTYPWVHRHGDRTYLFYNGNGFGETGFGYAELA